MQPPRYRLSGLFTHVREKLHFTLGSRRRNLIVIFLEWKKNFLERPLTAKYELVSEGHHTPRAHIDNIYETRTFSERISSLLP